jgi:cyclophilin family peptidyl-prolyl cis-trans isomerase
MKMCPFCGVEVNRENLNKHFKKVHSELDESDFKMVGYEKPNGDFGKKREYKEGTRESRKGNRIDNSRRNAVVVVIGLILVVSLMGTIMYQVLNQNTDPTEDSADNGSSDGKSVAVMTTTLGTIKIELDTNKAPVTAANFIALTNSGFYNGTIFHRVISGWVIQGGGFTPDGSHQAADTTPWENTGLKNSRYSISMARTGSANNISYKDTATSQFFINLEDNTDLDRYAYPYVVFGRVIEGFNVVDTIANLPTGTYNGMNDWPHDPPVITGIVIQD